MGIFLVHSQRQPLSQVIGQISWLLAFAGVCLLSGLLVLRSGWPKISALLALIGFVAAGSASSLLFAARFPPHHVRYLANSGIDLTGPIRLGGVLVSTPLRTPYGLQFDVDARKVEIDRPNLGITTRAVEGKVRLRLNASNDPAAWANIDLLHLQYGDRIRALASLRRPRIYRNPGSFDFRWWMESFEDVYWEGTIRNPLLVEKLPTAARPSAVRLLEATRQRLIHAIDAMYPPWSSNMRDGAVLKAILLGERASLDSDTIEGFRRSGLYHLLVIAGLHIGLLVLIVDFLLRLLPLGATRRSVLLLIFLAAYSVLVEQRTATLRATLMILAYLVARLLYRERVLLNAIGFAALVLLLVRPAWLLESGFQLSFSAVLLIAALVVPVLMRTTEPYRRALWNLEDLGPDIHFSPRQAQFRLDVRGLIAALKSHVGLMDRHPAVARHTVTAPLRVILWIGNILLFSAILQTGLLLPMAETFHRVTIAGIGLNALAIPVMVALLLAALPTVLLAALSPSWALWPSKALALVLKCLFALTQVPSLASWLSFRVPDPPTWVALGFTLSAITAAVALGRRSRVACISLLSVALFAGLISLHPFGPRLPSGVLEITALDCGSGRADFVVLPDRTTMLIGTCGSKSGSAFAGASQSQRWDPGEEIISPYLWSRGIQKVDILAVSDAREDSRGLATIVRNFGVAEIWRGANSFTAFNSALMEVVRRRRITIRDVAAGDIVARATTSIVILGPARTNGMLSASNPRGDDPLVIRIADQDKSALLSADSNTKLESELTDSPFPLQSQLLVTRQGAKTLSSIYFLGRVLPRVVLLSGDESRGQPSDGMPDQLRSIGARIYRTNLGGAVTVLMQGGSIAVHTYGAAPED